MNKQLIKISVIVIGALVLLVLALYLMKKDQDRPGKRNSVETIGEAIADKTFTTKSEAYMAYANEKDEFYRRSAASFAPPPAVSKKPEAEKAAAAASAAPAVENKAQEIRFEQAYEEISRNVRSIYEEAPDDTRTVAREQPEVATQQTPAADVPPGSGRDARRTTSAGHAPELGYGQPFRGCPERFRTACDVPGRDTRNADSTQWPDRFVPDKGADPLWCCHDPGEYASGRIYADLREPSDDKYKFRTPRATAFSHCRWKCMDRMGSPAFRWTMTRWGK